MAVTLTTDDLKYPDGELQASMFPDGDIDAALTSWLTTASSLTADNDAARHYVYYRGYNAVANRLAMMATSQSTNQGSHSVTWSDGRVTQWRELADYHKGEYDRINETSDLGQPRIYINRVSA